MKKDYLKLEDKNYRVEVNMNSTGEFEQVSGKTVGEFEADASNGNISFNDVLTWAWCAIREGEDMDGKEFQLTRRQLGRKMKPTDSEAFIIIFVRQFSGKDATAKVVEETENPQKKSKGIFHRMKSA